MREEEEEVVVVEREYSFSRLCAILHKKFSTSWICFLLHLIRFTKCREGVWFGKKITFLSYPILLEVFFGILSNRFSCNILWTLKISCNTSRIGPSYRLDFTYGYLRFDFLKGKLTFLNQKKEEKPCSIMFNLPFFKHSTFFCRFLHDPKNPISGQYQTGHQSLRLLFHYNLYSSEKENMIVTFFFRIKVSKIMKLHDAYAFNKVCNKWKTNILKVI